MSKKVFWFVGIFAVIIIAIIFLKDIQQKSVVIDYEGQPFIGEESAPVDIIEFGDYKCPHCQTFNDQIFPIIQEQLVDTGKAKFYFMNYPVIGPDSTSSARFAEAVYQELGSDTFWEFHHLLFANQTTKDGQTNYFSDDVMKEILSEIASNEEMQQVLITYNKEDSTTAVKKDVATGNSLSVTSTPTIFIDGKRFDGSSTSELIELVEKAADSSAK